jgi:hypothetical protein
MFGDTNTVGATYGSPYSIIGGNGNSVDGSSSELGSSCVVGDTCNVDGDYNTVSGYSHTVGASCCAVFGELHSVSEDKTLVYGAYASARWHGGMAAAGGRIGWPTDQYRRAQTTPNLHAFGYTVGSTPSWTAIYLDGSSSAISLILNQALFWTVDIIASKSGVSGGAPAIKAWTAKFVTHSDSSADSLLPIDISVETATDNSDEVDWDIRFTTSSGDLLVEVLGSDDATNPVAWSARLRNVEVNAERFADAT